MNNLSQSQETSYNDNTDTNETGERNQPGFAKKVAAIAAGLALTGTIGLGLSACGSDNVNAAPGSETTTSQSGNNNQSQANTNSQTQTTNNGDTNANNANTDSQAEAVISTFKSNFAKSGFTLDSSDAELLQSYKEYGGIEADIEFTYNGTTYKGLITTYDNNKSYLVEFDSIHFGDTTHDLTGAKDWIINNWINKNKSNS